MRFPLEVVIAGKKYITCRSHIKYGDNVDLKTETKTQGSMLKSTPTKP
jgi:hypothetical protein